MQKCFAKPAHQSIVKEAEIFFVKQYVPKEDCADLVQLLNDDQKLQKYKLYWWNEPDQKVTESTNWRKSFWFGKHAQAVQATGRYVQNKKGEKIEIPTDFVMPFEFPDEILNLKTRIEKDFDVDFNSCLVGKFDTPMDKIGYHSDSSNSMGPDPYIGSVSFGAPRKFRLKIQSKYCKNDKDREIVEILLEEGDLLVMRKNANMKYLHAVPRDPKCNKDNFRINLTFRNYTYDPQEVVYVAKPFHE